MIRALAAALLALATPAVAAEAPVAATLAANKFAGTALVAKGDAIVWQTPGSAGQVWPWASVTKQVVATLVMQDVAAGRLKLDAPASDYLPALGANAPTLRQLLQHRSGLRNPNDTPAAADGFPSFYTAERDPIGWCTAGRGATGGQWSYNNCDYILLGAVLEKVSGASVPALVRTRLARPLKLKKAQLLTAPADRVKLADGNPRLLAGFGAGAAMVGTPGDLLAFDRALATGKLLPEAARAEMWKGDPALGYMGLGQWAFSAPVKGCAKPVRIIERRGHVGTTQVRNLILPELDMTLILFTADADYDFGEIWQGNGLSHDLVQTAACA